MGDSKYKIIFLDIDGVLNSQQSSVYFHRKGHDNGGVPHYFCPIANSNLHEILEEFEEVRIVVSSSWRLGETLESMQKVLWDAGKIPPERVIGMTPRYPRRPDGRSEERGTEIEAWLKVYGDCVERYVIVDDDKDMGRLLPDLIHTDDWHGLTRRDAWKVIDRFYAPWSRVNPYQVAEHAKKHGCTNAAKFEKDDVVTIYHGKWDEKHAVHQQSVYETIALCKEVEGPRGQHKSFIKKI